ncbi:MFS transporter [Thermodesulfobacteriota bacterium]
MTENGPESETDRGRKKIFLGWWILAVGTFINAVGIGIVYHGFTVFFLPLKRELALSSAAISLVYGCSRLEGGVEGPLIGWLIDKFGPKQMIFFGSLLSGVGYIFLSRINSFPMFFIVYVFLIALGANAGFYHPVTTVINSWFIRHRGVAFGVLTAATSLGGMIAAPTLSYLILQYTWRTAAVFAGVTILVLILPASFFMFRSPEEKGLLPDGDPQSPENGKKENGLPASSIIDIDFTVKKALRTRAFWLLNLCTTLRVLVTITLTAHMVPVLVWKGVEEATAAYLVSMFAFLTMIGMLVMGWIGDRYSKSLLTSVALFASVLGLLWPTFSSSRITVYLFPIGMAIAMSPAPLNWSLIGDFFGRQSYATLRGITVVGVGIATFISPIYAGWVYDITKSYYIVLVSFSALLLLAAVLFAILRPPKLQ